MKKYKSTQKGFTLIELLMVIALIAILSTVILMSLDSGRERAEVNKYLAYGTQMHKMVADSVAAGKFDKGNMGSGSTGGNIDGDFCLGTYVSCGTIGTPISATAGGEAQRIFEAVTHLGDLPILSDENGFSPYAATQGITLNVDRDSNDYARVNLYLLDTTDAEDGAYADKICKSIGWSRSGDYCYIDVQLHSRL
ncbi:MAG: Tfp pilus assembly protein FimT/FimU [Candidatus Moraniibacteriota bacterium]|jgi:prepilin-type N-terminal cleavage/methylation domain-containing protein